MIKAERFKGLEEKIGYSFTNKRLLALAMTHSSYANEQRGRRKANNERLEFLGDAVLEVTISDYVFRNIHLIMKAVLRSFVPVLFVSIH